MTYSIIPLAKQHLDQVWAIERAAHSHPWSESMIRDLNSRGGCHHVLINSNDTVVGYYYAQNIVGEVTLLNIAIATDYQGQGLGKQLLNGLLAQCEASKAESVWLEVRASNASAFRLYQTLGFNEVDRRRNYYPTATGKEDAIIMSYLFFY